ncbi:alpha/beta fold hydrolase [Desulfobotulus mexicanus]|uniref:Alpha/beta hydrolase n=1 Tax=Desulfobotulus mexicanus TaxID=2586642 RepID=A0A5Q4VCF6_9BACT|nr:alpha/beta hydrolase [Desulfobotulus mexicanus]TYT74648.1 alpha/beta hydrolase [Desulfobotulus mexicanus]
MMSFFPHSILCVHGWAQSPDFWAPLRAFIEKPEALCLLDRGYFGSQHLPSLPQHAGVKGIITHSFGLHLVPEIWLKQADFIIIVSGFNSFLPEERSRRRRSERILYLMQKKLKENPEALVALFRSLCGQKENIRSGSVNTALMAEDLQNLAHSRLDLDLFMKIPVIHIIHGRKDKVVDVSRAEELQAALPHARLHIVDDGDHGIPLTHAGILAELLACAIWEYRS